jgi:hypothetical protein
MSQQTKTVSLNSGKTKKVQFTYTPTVAKVYSVTVDSLSGTFTASEGAWIPPEPLTELGWVTLGNYGFDLADPNVYLPLGWALQDGDITQAMYDWAMGEIARLS